jgi:iron complex outermembrane receptor protein
MISRRTMAGAMAGAVAACVPASAGAQSRSDENAVTQAEDAFGFSVGRESLGIYNAGNARGFSPSAAGNLRIEGLYFDQAYGLQGTLLDSTSIKVGLSAQGYPFAAPSGIVDQSLRRPSDKAGASVVANFDSFGTAGIEVDGSLPISDTLSLGYGLNGTHVEFPDGTSNWNYNPTLIALWRPAPGIEIMPFWSVLNDFNDEAGVFYVPAGDFLPKLAKQRDYEGPEWSDFRYTGMNSGILASARISQNWVVRLGAFRSVNDVQHGFTNILADEQPDGTGERLLFADPPTKSASTSGELRLTHSIPDGPRLHVIHLSVRARNSRSEFGGSELIDFGPGRIGEKVPDPEPDQFHFDEVGHDRVKQTTGGLAYDGRWKKVGEISFSLSKAHFRKETVIPGLPDAVTSSSPWLYNATAALELGKSVAVYAGYARGLEESGVAPPNAANRNQSLPVILTEQKDGGVRFNLSKSVKAVVGVFDLSRPYFGFDGANVFKQVGTVRSRGAEFSVSGAVTPKLDIVAGGMLLKPKVTASDVADDTIGSKPVGFPTHLLISSANWKTPFKGLELDVVLVHRGRAPATTNNAVFVPERARVDIGTHYRFKIGKRSATLRAQVYNLFDNAGFGVAGSGIYTTNPGRYVQGYLTVDF